MAVNHLGGPYNQVCAALSLSLWKNELQLKLSLAKQDLAFQLIVNETVKWAQHKLEHVKNVSLSSGVQPSKVELGSSQASTAHWQPVFLQYNQESFAKTKLFLNK